MKKSELRQIIRESIKELMNEQQGSNYSPGTTVLFKTCADLTTPSYYTFCMPTTVSPQVGSTYVNTNTVNSPIEGVKGFVVDVRGPCNSIQNGAQWQTTSVSVGSCPACCDTGAPLPFSPNHTSIWGMLGYQASGACVQACSSAGCDNTMAGSCAQNWLPPNLNWPNMANFACTGNQTYSGVEQNQLNQATNLLNQNGVTNIPSFNNYQDISNFVNGTGIGQPQKGQIKRKLAKSYWGGCMFNECNC